MLTSILTFDVGADEELSLWSAVFSAFSSIGIDVSDDNLEDATASHVKSRSLMLLSMLKMKRIFMCVKGC